MELRWSPEAAEDLANILRHVQRDNRDAAHKVVAAIFDSLKALPRSPYRGRAGKIDGTRELILAPLPYIAVYRVKSDAVEVVRIYHGAQNWP